MRAPLLGGSPLTGRAVADSMTQVTTASARSPMSDQRTARWRGMTIADQVARHARTTPSAPAFRFGGAGRSYAELDERVTRLAAALTDRGVRRGDRVAVLTLNGLEAVETFLAAARLGAIAVPVNFRLVADEVGYALSDSGATALVVDPVLAGTAAKARAAARELHAVLTVGEEYEAALAAASPEPVEPPVDEGDPAFLMYTSG